jgi:hypothetical protein
MCSVYYTTYIAYMQPDRIPKQLMNYTEEEQDPLDGRS